MKPSVYRRPAKPLYAPVTRRRDFEALPKAEPVEVVTVDRATECHVTPPRCFPEQLIRLW